MSRIVSQPTNHKHTKATASECITPLGELMCPFLESTSRKYHLECVDYFSQWVELFPLQKVSAEEVSQTLLHRQFCLGGVYQISLSQIKVSNFSLQSSRQPVKSDIVLACMLFG